MSAGSAGRRRCQALASGRPASSVCGLPQSGQVPSAAITTCSAIFAVTLWEGVLSRSLTGAFGFGTRMTIFSLSRLRLM